MPRPRRARGHTSRDPIEVTCACGWATAGAEARVVEAMQVHGRQIHGLEFSRDQVLDRTIDPPPS